jgi:hypothetical protein
MIDDEELIKALRAWDGSPFDDEAHEAADLIERLTAKLKLLEKADLYLKTSYPEKTGYYFICGEGGMKDGNGLPECVHICPAYGADWMMTYQRTDKAFGPEY